MYRCARGIEGQSILNHQPKVLIERIQSNVLVAFELALDQR